VLGQFPKNLLSPDYRVDWLTCEGCPENSGLYSMPEGEPLRWWRFGRDVVIESRPERRL
jgi:hypothetical protein